MVSFVFSIVTTFQIWACHATCAYKLSKNLISRDRILGKVTKYELDTCTGSRVITNFRWGGGGGGGAKSRIGLKSLFLHFQKWVGFKTFFDSHM